MAKISGSNSGSSADTLSQLKDQYQSREREIETRHREDVVTMNKNHETELNKLRQESQNRIQAVRDEADQKLSSKDMQHQKEIEALKTMYQKRVLEERKMVKPEKS